MLDQAFVGNYDFKSWKKIFMILEFLLIILIILCLGFPKWVYSDLRFKLKTKDGELDFFKLDCGIFYCYHPKYESYHILAKEIDLDVYKDSILDDAKALKSALLLLRDMGIFLILFYTLSLACILSWLLFMKRTTKVDYFYWISLASSILSFATFITGTVLWLIFAPARFKSCDYFPEDGSAAIICASASPVFSIMISIFFFFMTLAYLIIIIKVRNKSIRSGSQGQRIQISASIVERPEGSPMSTDLMIPDCDPFPEIPIFNFSNPLVLNKASEQPYIDPYYTQINNFENHPEEKNRDLENVPAVQGLHFEVKNEDSKVRVHENSIIRDE